MEQIVLSKQYTKLRTNRVQGWGSHRSPTESEAYRHKKLGGKRKKKSQAEQEQWLARSHRINRLSGREVMIEPVFKHRNRWIRWLANADQANWPVEGRSEDPTLPAAHTLGNRSRAGTEQKTHCHVQGAGSEPKTPRKYPEPQHHHRCSQSVFKVTLLVKRSLAVWCYRCGSGISTNAVSRRCSFCWKWFHEHTSENGCKDVSSSRDISSIRLNHLLRNEESRAQL